MCAGGQDVCLGVYEVFTAAAAAAARYNTDRRVSESVRLVILLAVKQQIAIFCARCLLGICTVMCRIFTRAPCTRAQHWRQFGQRGRGTVPTEVLAAETLWLVPAAEAAGEQVVWPARPLRANCCSETLHDVMSVLLIFMREFLSACVLLGQQQQSGTHAWGWP